MQTVPTNHQPNKAKGLGLDLAKLYKTIMENSGVTINPITLHVPDDGYICSLAGNELRLSVDLFSVHWLETFIRLNRKHWSNNSLYFGAWIKDGFVYLDVSESFNRLEDAVNAGRERKQLTVWDVSDMVEIAVTPVHPDLLTQVITPKMTTIHGKSTHDEMIQTAIACGRIMYSKDGTLAHGSCRKVLTEGKREVCGKWGVTALLPLFYAETSADYVELIFDEVDTFTLVAYTKTFN